MTAQSEAITLSEHDITAHACSTTNEYGMKRDGESCFDINASEPNFEENISARIRRPFSPFFLWPFSKKTTFLFLRTKLAHLPVPVDFFRPIHTHKPSQLQNKIGIKPTPGNPPENGVTKLRLHMTPPPAPFFAHTHMTAQSEATTLSEHDITAHAGEQIFGVSRYTDELDPVPITT